MMKDLKTRTKTVHNQTLPEVMSYIVIMMSYFPNHLFFVANMLLLTQSFLLTQSITFYFVATSFYTHLVIKVQ